MLLNDFYTCHNLVQGNNEISCRAVFNAAHDIFKGHFPGQPVVPGVCMIEMVKELLQERVNAPLMLSVADSAKFLQLITPDITPDIKISWKEHERGYVVNAIFKGETIVYFKLSGSYILNGSITQ